ncbi:pyrroline-5-carboxylate reductase [Nocardia sp. GAS34]
MSARLRGGKPVTEIASETGISPATLFQWKAQALIDAGVRDGTPSVEADELAAAHSAGVPYMISVAGVREPPVWWQTIPQISRKLSV